MSAVKMLSQGTNAKNVEFKAKLDNIYPMIKLLQSKTGMEGTVIQQRDTYYKVKEGKLKMRKFENPTKGIIAELIFYKRPNDARPKVCSYQKVELNQEKFEQLHEILSTALGVEATVIKKRVLFIIKNTRIHIDDVHGLGFFIELETVLQDNQTEEDGFHEIKQLMAELGINECNILGEGYLELLNSVPEQYKGKWLPKLLNKCARKDNDYDLDNINVLESSWSQTILNSSIKDDISVDENQAKKVNSSVASTLEPGYVNLQYGVSWSDVTKSGKKSNIKEIKESTIENRNLPLYEFDIKRKFSL